MTIWPFVVFNITPLAPSTLLPYDNMTLCGVEHHTVSTKHIPALWQYDPLWCWTPHCEHQAHPCLMTMWLSVVVNIMMWAPSASLPYDNMTLCGVQLYDVITKQVAALWQYDSMWLVPTTNNSLVMRNDGMGMLQLPACVCCSFQATPLRIYRCMFQTVAHIETVDSNRGHRALPECDL